MHADIIIIAYYLFYLYTSVYSDPSTLLSGEKIKNSEDLKSGNGNYRLSMQDDGNLALYTKEGKALWASDSAGKGSLPYTLFMQPDMNLVVYDQSNTAVWNIDVYIGKGGDWTAGGHAKLQDDGNFVVYDGSNKVMWESGTSGGTKSAKWKTT